MRILTVGSMYPPLHLGGYELVWASAVEHLRERGHSVCVLTSDHGVEGAPPAEDAAGDVHRELRLWWRDHEFPRLAPWTRVAIERRNAVALERHLTNFRPDLVCWWAMGGLSLSLIVRVRRVGLPAAAVVCDDWLLYGPKVDAWLRVFARRPWLAAPVERLTGIPTRFELGATTRFLFLGETVRRRALNAHSGLEGEAVALGPDRELFAPADPHPWRWKLLYVGRIDPRKGIDTAILALEMLPAEATLTVDGAGDRAHANELRALATERGLGERVRFVRSAREEVPSAYAEADAVLFPVSWAEPWGLVPLEAMSVGTPVVATGRGGSGEYLRDEENCLLFEPDEGPSALAEQVKRLAGDEALRARLREGGLRTASRITEHGWNEAVERVCADAVAGSAR